MNLYFILFSYYFLIVDGQINDPSEYFHGVLARPKIEIIKPENNEVLDDQELVVNLNIIGYDAPSLFHESKICLTLTANSNDIMKEQCFSQSYEMVYSIRGLTPGESYSLRVLFTERSKIIAVSVRNFHVAGILIKYVEDLIPNQLVTIQTALAVAAQAIDQNSLEGAENIYHQILTQNPMHHYALHLLGVVHVLRGDYIGAIPYIEKALLANKSFENLQNTLGECYRILEKFDLAETHYNMALDANPKFGDSLLNLGKLYQETNRPMQAITQFKKLNYLIKAKEVSEMSLDLVIESKIRECDLLNALNKNEAYIGSLLHETFGDELTCWQEGVSMFPNNIIFLNQLGNTYIDRGNKQRGYDLYLLASNLGDPVAAVNVAVLLEQQGHYEDSRAAFNDLLSDNHLKYYNSFYLRIKMALVQSRVHLTNPEDMINMRNLLEKEIDELLQIEIAPHDKDESSPIEYGFSQGYFLVFHGYNNAQIKHKMAQLYIKFCPALRNGKFITINRDIMQSSSSSEILELKPSESESELVFFQQSENSLSENSVTQILSANKTCSNSQSNQSIINIGFISRHLSNNFLGHMMENIICLLSSSIGIKVHVFMLPNEFKRQTSANVISNVITESVLICANKTVNLPNDIWKSKNIVLEHNLDILIYPEIGHDPMIYFMAYLRLAPVQAVMSVVPDTTGIPTIDFFLSDTIELDVNSEMHYTEHLFRMKFFGTCFTDRFSMTAIAHQSARTSMLSRAKFIESIGLPRAAHIYVIAQPVYAISNYMEEVIIKIVSQDKLGYIIILDDVHNPDWNSIFINKLIRKYKDIALKTKVLFIPTSEEIPFQKVLINAHVVLDTFPASTFFPSFLSLALGVPLITLPSNRLAGKLAMSLYNIIDYDELVVHAVPDYVNLALLIAHKPKLRQHHVDKLISKRGALFNCSHVISEWHRFIEFSLFNHKAS